LADSAEAVMLLSFGLILKMHGQYTAAGGVVLLMKRIVLFAAAPLVILALLSSWLFVMSVLLSLSCPPPFYESN
jgi:hypothetical protein